MLHDKATGLTNIWLENGYQIHETKWGKGLSVENQEGLSDAIVIELCTSRHRLDGDSVRFLRRYIGLTQGQLGSELGCGDQAVAKWEKGEIAIVPIAPARLLRLLALKHLSPRMPIASALNEYDEETPEKMVFSYLQESGWQCADHRHATVNVTVRKSNVIDFIEAMNAVGSVGHFDSDVLSRFADNDQEYGRNASKLAATG